MLPPATSPARSRRAIALASAAGAIVCLAAALTSCGRARDDSTSTSATADAYVAAGIRDGRANTAPRREMAAAAERSRAATAPPPAPPEGMVAIHSVQISHDSVGAPSQPQDAVAMPSMIIRTADASVRVDSLDVAIAQLRQLGQRLGGYVANSALEVGGDQARSARLELKIPSARFDEAIGGLKPIGRVESVNISTEDVGEEFVDVSARVSNAHRLESRLIDLLARRTGKLEDVLQVERELARVREEIERYEGRIRYLRTRTAISTLSVTAHERAPILRQPGRSPLAEASVQAWRNFISFLSALIAALGVLIPLGLVLGGVAWGVRQFWPRRSPPAPALESGD